MYNPQLKTSPPLFGEKHPLSGAHSFRRDIWNGEGGSGPPLASQIDRINQGDQWSERCHSQVAFRFLPGIKNPQLIAWLEGGVVYDVDRTVSTSVCVIKYNNVNI